MIKWLGRLGELVQSGLKSNTMKPKFETSSLPANLLNKGVWLLRCWENRCLGAVYLPSSVFCGGCWFLPLLGRRSLVVDCHGIHPDNKPPLPQLKRLSIVTQHNCPTLQFLWVSAWAEMSTFGNLTTKFNSPLRKILFCAWHFCSGL